MESVMTEGIGVLSEKQIPYKVERYGDDRTVPMVEVPISMKDSLMNCGFRVGHAMFNGKSVVYYKGRFFGITAG